MNSPFMQKAINIVWSYAASRFDATDKVDFTADDVYVVWFSKTLQNWKALLSTTLPDLKYYEVTYDGDKKQAYLDVYVKHDNLTIQDSDHSSGNFHMHSNATGEEIDSMIPVVSNDESETVVPVMYGEGDSKRIVGSAYNFTEKDGGLSFSAVLDGGDLVEGFLPKDNLGPMSFKTVGCWPPVDEGSVDSSLLRLGVKKNFEGISNFVSGPVEKHDVVLPSIKTDPAVLEELRKKLMENTRPIVDEELRNAEASENNKFMRNITPDEVDRIGVEEVQGRIEPEFPFAKTDNRNRVGFTDRDFGLGHVNMIEDSQE